MKKGIIKRILAICLLSIMMLMAVSCDRVTPYESDRFDVELKCGYGNNVEIGSYAPFYIEITNNGKDFEGFVQLIIPGRDNMNIMHQKEISIQQGATKKVELVGFIDMITRQVNVRILDDNDNVIWAKLQSCSTMADLRSVNVGILSDDYSALGYMDHKPFTANKEMTTQIYELTKDTFPSDWRAMDMLDVVVISDFSTDMLSEEQLNALALWVDGGGLLMVGTGSTANKTLASLNSRMFDVTVGNLVNYRTKFGLTLTDYSYDYGDGYNSYYSAYDDTFYESFYKESYESLYDSLKEEYMDDFEYNYGYDPDFDTWDEYWEESFYWFCFEEFYEVYLESLGEGSGIGAVDEMSYVKADVLELSGEQLEDKETEVFYGEAGDNDFSDVYDLAYAIPRGEGCVLLSCVDFTKTPLSNYEGNSTLFIHWVETLIGQKIYDEALDYSNYSSGYYNLYDIDYNEEQVYESVASATVPPILIYFGILLLYIIAILVVYLVLRHKKKTMKLWVIYPAIAAGLTVLIFCIGFSTRIYRPVVNAVTLIEPSGSALTQHTYTGITVPRNKVYDISFASEQGVEYIQLNRYSSSYNDQMEIDWDSYSVGYTYGYDSVDVSVGEMTAMSTVYFKLTSVVPSDRDVEVFSDNGYSSGLSVTNNYGCTLENAVFIVDGDYYVIGDIQDGETVRWSRLEESEYVYGIGDAAMEGRGGMKILGLIFGSISGQYDEYLRNLRALNSLTDLATDYYYGADVVFVATPSESSATELQGETNYNERRAEIIYIEYDF